MRAAGAAEESGASMLTVLCAVVYGGQKGVSASLGGVPAVDALCLRDGVVVAGVGVGATVALMVGAAPAAFAVSDIIDAAAAGYALSGLSDLRRGYGRASVCAALGYQQQKGVKGSMPVAPP
jgi:hypothetical protein